MIDRLPIVLATTASSSLRAMAKPRCRRRHRLAIVRLLATEEMGKCLCACDLPVPDSFPYECGRRWLSAVELACCRATVYRGSCAQYPASTRTIRFVRPHQSIDTDNFARVDVKGDVVDHRIASGIDAGNMFRFENRRAERAARLKKITHRVAAQHFTHNPRHIDIANSGFGPNLPSRKMVITSPIAINSSSR